jgi:hypothetical protein
VPLSRTFVDPARGERSSGYCFRHRSVGRRLVAEALGGLSFVRSLASLGVTHLEVPRRHHVEVDLVVALLTYPSCVRAKRFEKCWIALGRTGSCLWHLMTPPCISEVSQWRWDKQVSSIFDSQWLAMEFLMESAKPNPSKLFTTFHPRRSDSCIARMSRDFESTYSDGTTLREQPKESTWLLNIQEVQ